MHRFSPEAPESLQALRDNAAAFDRFARLVKQHWTQHDTLLAFAPDHGCHPIDGGLGSHGLDMPEDMLIPHFYGAVFLYSKRTLQSALERPFYFTTSM